MDGKMVWLASLLVCYRHSSDNEKKVLIHVVSIVVLSYRVIKKNEDLKLQEAVKLN